MPVGFKRRRTPTIKSLISSTCASTLFAITRSASLPSLASFSAHRKPKKSCIVDANRVCLSHRPVNRIDTKAGNPAIHEIAEEISVIAGLQYRLASYLAEASAHPFQADTISGLVYRLASAASRSPQMRPRDRAILVTWAIICVLVPPRFRQNLILWRFAPTSRPRVIKALLGALSSLRSPRLPDRAETG